MEEQTYLIHLENLSNHINRSIAHTVLESNNLPDSILKLEGMSSHGNRRLLNHLCSCGGSYLEIGSWKGSTFISALYKNNNTFGTSIDNHEEFKNSIFKTSSEELKSNCSKNLVNNEKYELITADCFSPDINLTRLYNIYFYDGYHTYDNQYKAITAYYKNLTSIFIYICDDYSIDRVEKGTKDAFRDMNIQVINEYKLFGNQLIPSSTTRGFWNGFYVALCVKKNDFPQFFKKEKYAHCFDSN
jgi:hypothetical protein